MKVPRLLAIALIAAAVTTVSVAATAVSILSGSSFWEPINIRAGVRITPRGTNANNLFDVSATMTNIDRIICDGPNDTLTAGAWSALNYAGKAGFTTSESMTLDSAYNWSGYTVGQTACGFGSACAPRLFTSGAGTSATNPGSNLGSGIGDSCSVVLDAATSASNQVALISYNCVVVNGTAAKLYLLNESAVGPITPKSGRRCVRISGS